MRGGPPPPSSKGGEPKCRMKHAKASCSSAATTKGLDDEQRLAFYDALIEYALNDTEPTISGVPKSCFAFVKPVLDRSKARAEAGRKGGKSKREANSKQNGSNSKQPGSKPEAIKDKGRDKGLGKDKQEDEEDNPPYPPSGDDVGQPPESPGVDPDFSEEEPPRPRRRKPSTLSKTQEARFNRFWAIYPRKVSIGDAEKAWAKIEPSEELTDTIVAAVETAKRCDTRFRETRYTPHPASWLNSKSWENQYDGPEDYPPPPPPRGPGGRPDTLGVLEAMLGEEGGDGY